MKRSVSAGFAALLTATIACAGPAESALVAAMKLPDASNYSWVTDVDDDARSYEITGKTDKVTDLSLVTMPMVGAVSRRITRGSAGPGTDATAIFKGAENFVVQVDDSWKKPDELASNSRYGSRGGYGGYGGGWGGMRGRGRRGMMGGGGGRMGGPSDGSDARTTPAYSNLQKTLSRPHEEV